MGNESAEKSSRKESRSVAKNMNRHKHSCLTPKHANAELADLIQRSGHSWSSGKPDWDMAGCATPVGVVQSNPVEVLFGSHLLLEYAMRQAYANKEVGRMDSDIYSHEYLFDKGISSPHENRQWNNANEKETTAQTLFHAVSQPKAFLRDNLSQISLTNADIVQRKGPYLNNLDNKVEVWQAQSYNASFKHFVVDYKNIGMTDQHFQYQINLLELIKGLYRDSFNVYQSNDEKAKAIFLECVDKEIAYVKKQINDLQGEQKRELKPVIFRPIKPVIFRPIPIRKYPVTTMEDGYSKLLDIQKEFEKAGKL
jgi:hypothetical protein